MKIASNNRFDKQKFINLRVAKGLTITRLSQEIGVAHNTIFEIEYRPNRAMSAEIVFRYCDYFEVSILELMSDKQVSVCANNLAKYLSFHEVIDEGTANGIINFYKER